MSFPRRDPPTRHRYNGSRRAARALYHVCPVRPVLRLPGRAVFRHGGEGCASAYGAHLSLRMARPLYAQINLAALRANLARVRTLAPGTQVLAVVKANAYGHGLSRVLPALEDADGLALVELDAAVELRERRYSRRILLIEGFFERARAAGVRAAAARHRGPRHGAGAHAGACRAVAAARGVREGEHRHEPAGLPARGRSPACASACRRRRRWRRCG